MAICFTCGTSVGMPYSCKLCKNKFCAQHRLPENHSCLNLGHYSSPEYKQEKKEKEREIARAKIMNQPKTTTIHSGSSSNLLNTIFTLWSHNQNKINLVIFAILMSLISRRQVYAQLGFLAILYVFIFSGLLGYLIYQNRMKIAMKYGIISNYYFYKWLAPIFAILGFFVGAWPLFGRFIDSQGNFTGKVKIAQNTIYSLITVWIFSFIVNLFLSAIIPLDLLYALLVVGRLFLMLAIYQYLPFPMQDGKILWDYNRTIYIIGAIILIIAYFIPTY